MRENAPTMETAPVRVVRDASELPSGFRVATLPPMPRPSGVLVCAPDHFDVIDVKNPHMRDQVGRVDRRRARVQWDRLVATFADAGAVVERIPPTAGCEDMVFTANQTFTGLDAAGRPLCVLSSMRHASRRREVPAFEAWFRGRGWRVAGPLAGGAPFEGGGDALWHPGRRLVWAGHGFRSGPEVHAELAAAFECSVFALELRDERFYHLDTCLAPLDERAALFVPGAFTAQGRALLARAFECLVEVREDEASGALACNAAAFAGGAVVLDDRAAHTAHALGELGYRVLPVDTGEYLKSGGSVFCMKQWLFTSSPA